MRRSMYINRKTICDLAYSNEPTVTRPKGQQQQQHIDIGMLRSRVEQRPLGDIISTRFAKYISQTF
jgi:hypothetical protein